MSIEQSLMFVVACIAVCTFLGSSLRTLLGGRQQQRQ
jgi:hypothetical protein